MAQGGCTTDSCDPRSYQIVLTLASYCQNRKFLFQRQVVHFQPMFTVTRVTTQKYKEFEILNGYLRIRCASSWQIISGICTLM